MLGVPDSGSEMALDLGGESMRIPTSLLLRDFRRKRDDRALVEANLVACEHAKFTSKQGLLCPYSRLARRVGARRFRSASRIGATTALAWRTSDAFWHFHLPH
jgi:hypothetical protein